jgi:glycine/D-amino acid oxidase-like deaminating enzyme
MKVAVIGGGAFGAMIALKLSGIGVIVSLFERQPDLLLGTSSFANRVHLGYHYPRDDETIRQCIRGFEGFKSEFGGAVIPNLNNAYFVAREGSLTSSDDFIAMCNRHGLRYREIDPARFEPAVSNVELGVLTDEVMFDPAILRQILSARLQQSTVVLRLNTEVADLRKDESGFGVAVRDHGNERFDAVVNCTYSEINRLTAALGLATRPLRYEYAAFPLIELDQPAPASITIVDGPLMCLLPYGASGLHLLYNTPYSAIAQDSGPFLNRSWRNPAASPFAAMDPAKWSAELLENSGEFIPALRRARVRSICQAVRTVRAGAAEVFARPSIVTLHSPGYVTVLSGKIDHCTWVADDVAAALGCHTLIEHSRRSGNLRP